MTIGIPLRVCKYFLTPLRNLGLIGILLRISGLISAVVRLVICVVLTLILFMRIDVPLLGFKLLAPYDLAYSTFMSMALSDAQVY